MSKCKIISQINNPISETEYWQNMANSTEKDLPIMPIKCHDCAIDFYGEMAISLSKQPLDVINSCLPKWFCHNNCKMACKGANEFFTPILSI
jgi:hypothetical protein